MEGRRTNRDASLVQLIPPSPPSPPLHFLSFLAAAFRLPATPFPAPSCTFLEPEKKVTATFVRLFFFLVFWVWHKGGW